MKIYFKNLILVNFGSYTNSNITLTDRSFCLVSGQNNFIKDNALSNGSGKSTIWSALCWVLTGETISGLHNNLKNINADTTDDSYAILEFTVDNDEYVISRYISPKSDLKIIKNSVDISGKGIRESERILSENLPDLTKNLISSTILLGQGMPNKFSSFTPSGRKDLLETLTKSDFMINDIKERLAIRRGQLTSQIRVYEDSLLTNATQLDLNKSTYKKLKSDLSEKQSIDYQKNIDELTNELSKLTAKIDLITNKINELDVAIDILSNKLLLRTEQKANENDLEFKSYSEAYNKYNSDKQIKLASISYLQTEVKKLQAIKDICPTCGQKIPGVLKPDVSEQLSQIAAINTEIAELTLKLTDISNKHQQYINQINAEYSDIIDMQANIKSNKNIVSELRNELNSLNAEFITKNNLLSTATYNKQNNENTIKAIIKNIDDLDKVINDIATSNRLIEAAKLDYEERLAINKQMESFSKREFRGYLLYNIIEYLNKKAKEYSQIVFGTSELNIYLDNNAIDISYCNKSYESLSGGEKQRIDLITQFAIRDLLQYYFNYSSNILVLDEITDNLDKIATSKIFDLITNKLRDIESVFIISHHADELEIPVDSELHVIKDRFGNSYIQES